jgi:hypothetical protein
MLNISLAHRKTTIYVHKKAKLGFFPSLGWMPRIFLTQNKPLIHASKIRGGLKKRIFLTTVKNYYQCPASHTTDAYNIKGNPKEH